MPKFAAANPNIRLDFVNGNFGYFYKSVNKEDFNIPEEQKYFYDNTSLKPVIMPFLENLKANSDFKEVYLLLSSTHVLRNQEK